MNNSSEKDGINIFPKLPVQIRLYHKRWERNQRIKTAVRKTKKPKEALDNVMKKNSPSQGTATDKSTTAKSTGSLPATASGLLPNRTFVFPPVQYPTSLPMPSVQAFNPLVAPIYVHHSLVSGVEDRNRTNIPMVRGQGQRGKDKNMARTDRTCRICKEKGKTVEIYTTCPGRWKNSSCVSVTTESNEQT
jgi:hypothetical protein